MKKEKQAKELLIISVILTVIAGCTSILAQQYAKKYRLAKNNEYNMAFFEVVDYMENVESFLAKSLITKEAESSTENLIQVWRETNLVQTYLSQLPVNNEGLSKTQKFLNQTSEYTYSLFRKNVKGINLSDEEMKKLKELHDYSMELKNILNQLSEDLNGNRLNWEDLEDNASSLFSKQIENVSKDGFDTIESNFEQYDGLIYDGAYSEHVINDAQKGVTGEIIEEAEAEKIAKDFIGNNEIQSITANGLSENGNIPCYTFTAFLKQDTNNPMTIAIAKKGGHIVFSNYNRKVENQIISDQEADEYAKKFLNQRGLDKMEKTYYTKEANIMTINYAYQQENVIIYTDLVKVKVALDNGDILGVETTGYLNNHEKRDINKKNSITKEKAKENINQELDIQGERFAIIPTEFKTEIFCWEIKGKINDRDFLVYVNAKTGKIENILVITETGNGTVAM